MWSEKEIEGENPAHRFQQTKKNYFPMQVSTRLSQTAQNSSYSPLGLIAFIHYSLFCYSLQQLSPIEAGPSSRYFEAFLCGTIFDNTAFCLGEKQGMLVNH